MTGWQSSSVAMRSMPALLRHVTEFPPLAVYERQMTPAAYLAAETDGTSNREHVLEELLMVWLDNMNPAASPFSELFDHSALARETPYLQMIHLLREFFSTEPAAGPGGQNLIDLLRSPAVQVPLSLAGQLQYMRENWSALVGAYLERLLGSLDVLAEEEKPSFQGPGPAHIIQYAGTGLEAEYERYSTDQEWMPRLVLLAKSAYVWLDQLSRKHQRPITQLDQIPDEELDTLRPLGVQRPVADRPVGAQPGVAAHQADDGQPGGRRVRILPFRLSNCGGPGRGGGVPQPGRPRLAARHPPRERHGSQPHGHRLAVGAGTPRLVYRPGL